MQQTMINGVDTDRMTATVQAVGEEPLRAAFQFRARNQWILGGHNQTTVKDFSAAGEEVAGRTQPFILEADEPPQLLGEDHSANPAEYLLHALAACLTTSMVYHAAARGIQVEDVRSELEGDCDLRGFLGLSEEVRKGFQGIRVKFFIKADASAEQLAELCKFSPIYDTVANPVPVSIRIEKQ